MDQLYDWAACRVGSTDYQTWDGIHYSVDRTSGRTLADGYQAIVPRWGGKAGRFTVFPGDNQGGGRERSDTQNWIYDRAADHCASRTPDWRDDQKPERWHTIRVQPGDEQYPYRPPVGGCVVWQVKPEDPLKYWAQPVVVLNEGGPGGWRFGAQGGHWNVATNAPWSGQYDNQNFNLPSSLFQPGKYHDFLIGSRVCPGSPDGWAELWIRLEGQADFVKVWRSPNMRVGWWTEAQPHPAHVFVCGPYRGGADPSNAGAPDTSVTRVIISHASMSQTKAEALSVFAGAGTGTDPAPTPPPDPLPSPTPPGSGTIPVETSGATYSLADGDVVLVDPTGTGHRLWPTVSVALATIKTYSGKVVEVTGTHDPMTIPNWPIYVDTIKEKATPPEPPVPEADVPLAISELTYTLNWMAASKASGGLGYAILKVKKTHAYKAMVALGGEWPVVPATPTSGVFMVDDQAPDDWFPFELVELVAEGGDEDDAA